MTTNPIKKHCNKKVAGGGWSGRPKFEEGRQYRVLHKIPTILGRLLARLLQVYWSINFKLLKKKYK